MKYRAEIEGLRALAVISVILFHAGFELFRGGYLGVDVFFVISGYLITTILIEDIEKKSFNFVNFYERRLRRILPALIFVLLVTYVVSYFIYLPGPHKIVGQNIVTSILSISNIFLYLKGNNYFGLETGSNPLFHTWSLSVELQFYLFFPVFFLLAWRFGMTKIFWLVFSIIILSLIVSEWGWRNNPTANFYLLPSRAWELFVGVFVAFIVQKQGVRKNNVFALIGISSIIFSTLFYNEKIPSPSMYTLVPVSGTVLLILFADRETLVAKLLGSKVFVGMGLISYSVYLWHLPIQIYFNYLFPKNYIANFFSYFCLIILSYVSYCFVERPFRKELSRFATYSIISLSSVILIALGVLGHINGGFPNRTDMFSQLQINNGWGTRCNGNTTINAACAQDSTPGVAILGNSYAMTWVNSVKSIEGISVVQLTQDSCAIGFAHTYKDVNSLPCGDFFAKATQTILGSYSIKTVILSSPFGMELSSEKYVDSLIDLFIKLHSKKIIVIGPTPDAPFSVGECFVRQSSLSVVGNCDFQVQAEHYNKISKLAKLLHEFKNIKFYDITDIICPNGTCVMRPQKDIIMYVDTGHLSVKGAEYVLKKINLSLL